MIPEIANVLLLLLEGHLIADGIGLVSHWGSDGVWRGFWWKWRGLMECRVRWGLDEVYRTQKVVFMTFFSAVSPDGVW